MEMLDVLNGLVNLGASNGDIVLLILTLAVYKFIDTRLKPETVEKSILDKLVALLSISIEKQEETLSALTRTVIKQEVILEYLAKAVSDCPKPYKSKETGHYSTGNYEGAENTYGD